MAKFVMLGHYSTESAKHISAKRSEKAMELVGQFGGKIVDGYGLLGEYDILVILEAPDIGKALQISVGLTKLLDISFETSPAVSMDEFDKLMEAV